MNSKNAFYNLVDAPDSSFLHLTCQDNDALQQRKQFEKFINYDVILKKIK